MNKIKGEYIWIDGYLPTANLRSKTKIVNGPVNGLSKLPDWGLMDLVQNKRLVIIVIAH